ncbi:MAG: hypothetical protein HON90_03045 [Halobacteriovoraceae bacterium]|jgi:hypothetical protein|nr:hypothetical protein [Halobacteriovoraceae bacterium]
MKKLLFGLIIFGQIGPAYSFVSTEQTILCVDQESTEVLNIYYDQCVSPYGPQKLLVEGEQMNGYRMVDFRQMYNDSPDSKIFDFTLPEESSDTFPMDITLESKKITLNCTYNSNWHFCD